MTRSELRDYNGHMAVSVGIREAKARLSELVRIAEAGEDVTITERGRPAVRLLPAAPRTLEERLGALEASGAIRRPASDGRLAKLPMVRPKTPNVAQAWLREERDRY